MKVLDPQRCKEAPPSRRKLRDVMVAQPVDSRSCRRFLGMLIEEGALDEAVKVYSIFSRKSGGDRKAGRMVAWACADGGDISGAVRIFKNLIKRFPHDYANFKELEKLYLRIGKPEKAIALYKGIRHGHPLKRKSYKRLTGIYYRLGEVKRAAYYLRKEIKEYGSTPRCCKELGKLYMVQGEYVKAVQSFQNALAKDRDDRSLRIWLGVALMENGNYELAEYEYAQLMKKKPHGFQELIHMAELRIREHRCREAEDYLAETERHYPNNSRVKLCRAEIALLEERYRDAVKLGRQVLRQAPFYYAWEQMRCHRILKHAYRALHDQKQSTLHKEMQEALKKSRDVFDGLIRIAELKNRNGQPDEGRKILELILDLYPGNARARVALAESLLTKRDDGRAVGVAESVIEDAPPSLTMERCRAHAVLAKAYGRLGEKEKAASHKRRRSGLQKAGHR